MGKLGPPRATKASMKDAHDEIGYRVLQEMVSILDCLEFDVAVECLRCRSHCFLNPRQSGYSDSFWVEMSGTTCVAFAQVGGHGGWLHPSTFPALVWAESCRYWRPDIVIHECAPAFTPA
eukprot:10604848-Alexandrium_andersonii.AAC.1